MFFLVADGFGIFLLLEEFCFGALDLCLAVGFGFLFDLCLKFLFGHHDHAFANFNFLFLLGDFSFGLSHVDFLLLRLLLDFVGRVSDCLFGIGNLLQVRFFHGEVVLFLCNFKFGGNCGVVCFFFRLRLSNADVSFGICL